MCDVSRPARTLRRITGTPLYLAPELMTDGAASIASDIYSLGVLLFHLASGSYPVLGDSVEELGAAHRRRNVRCLSDLQPDLPQELCQLVDRALRVDPRARYRSAGAMQRALGRTRARIPVVGPRRRRRRVIRLRGVTTFKTAVPPRPAWPSSSALVRPPAGLYFGSRTKRG